MYTNQNNYLQYSCFLSSCHTRNGFFFQFYSFRLILFKYPNCNRIVIVKVIMITSCFAMYAITITCNHKNKRLQITFWLLKTCNWSHVITITDYSYNRSGRYTVFQFFVQFLVRLSWLWGSNSSRISLVKLIIVSILVVPDGTWKSWKVFKLLSYICILLALMSNDRENILLGKI